MYNFSVSGNKYLVYYNILASTEVQLEDLADQWLAAVTRNSSGDERPERNIDAVRYISFLLIAHTAVANSTSPHSHGEYNKRCPKSGAQKPH